MEPITPALDGVSRQPRRTCPNGAGTGLTNEKWSLPLLRELGFGLLPTTAGPEIAGVPTPSTVSLVPSRYIWSAAALPRSSCCWCARRRSRQSAWSGSGVPQSQPRPPLGIVSNGLRIRLLRDNQALSRQSFIEFDLEAMFAGELYSDFVLLWLVAHATRFARARDDEPDTCWLEQWTKIADEQGTRALRELRGGVEHALKVLGEGFTAHPRNTALREALRSSGLSPADFHGQLLRVVYRLIFLFVAEDRTLEGEPLLHPRDSSETGRFARERYAAHYSAARLRIVGSIRAAATVTFGDSSSCSLSRYPAKPEANASAVILHSQPPATSSGTRFTAALNDAELMNFDLLEALRHFAFNSPGQGSASGRLQKSRCRGARRRIRKPTRADPANQCRWRALHLRRVRRKRAQDFRLLLTPDTLVQCLLDSALDPVVEEAIKSKVGVEAGKAILALKICDPAVGSGHFLVGAAHRLARHLARVRALAHGESEPSPLLYQHALRDVIGRCLYMAWT